MAPARSAHTLLAALALAVPAAASAAPSVSLVGRSPADGAVLPAQDAPYLVFLEWRSDTAGCGADTVTGTVVVSREQKEPMTDPVTGSSPSQSTELSAAVSQPTVYTWYARVECPSAPGGEIRSEVRTFTLTGNPPRLDGVYVTSLGGYPATWRFTASCPQGACDATATRPFGTPFRLTYDAERRRYRGTFARQSAPERVCRVRVRTTRTMRTIPGAYVATRGVVDLTVGGVVRNVDRTATMADNLVGSQVATYRLTARGAKAGCPQGTRMRTRLIAVPDLP